MARLSDIALARVIHLDRQRHVLSRQRHRLDDGRTPSMPYPDPVEMQYHLARWENHSRSWRHSIKPDTGSPNPVAPSRS